MPSAEILTVRVPLLIFRLSVNRCPVTRRPPSPSRLRLACRRSRAACPFASSSRPGESFVASRESGHSSRVSALRQPRSRPRWILAAVGGSSAPGKSVAELLPERVRQTPDHDLPLVGHRTIFAIADFNSATIPPPNWERRWARRISDCDGRLRQAAGGGRFGIGDGGSALLPSASTQAGQPTAATATSSWVTVWNMVVATLQRRPAGKDAAPPVRKSNTIATVQDSVRRHCAERADARRQPGRDRRPAIWPERELPAASSRRRTGGVTGLGPLVRVRPCKRHDRRRGAGPARANSSSRMRN